jgi:hypothetical protein
MSALNSFGVGRPRQCIRGAEEAAKNDFSRADPDAAAKAGVD